MSYETHLNHTIGVNLRAEMLKRGKTTNDLGSLLNLSPSSVQRRLAGKTSMPLDEIGLVVQTWGIDINDLIRDLPKQEVAS